MTCPQFETHAFSRTPEKEALARQPWARGQNHWVDWRNPHSSPALPAVSSVLRGYRSHITGPFSNTAERRKTFSKVIFILSFWISFPSSRDSEPSPGDQGSALAGTGGAPLGPAVPSCRQVILPLSISSLWLGNGTPHGLRPPFLAFHFPLYFHASSLPLALICLLPVHNAALASASSTLPSPLRTPSHPLSPPCPAPPQSPLSCLRPFVLTVVGQLGLHFESKSEAVCGEKMEKWQNGWGEEEAGIRKPHFCSLSLSFSGFGTGSFLILGKASSYFSAAKSIPAKMGGRYIF